jgi:hypothetical protein
MVEAFSTESDETNAALFVATGNVPVVLLKRDGKLAFRAIAPADNNSAVYVYSSSGTPVAGLQTVSGNQGQVGVFMGTQSIAVLAQGHNGGELELSDIGGTPMVQAGTLPTHVGIVRTGPASRAPGGLMGVPGSYITGKGN